ncbi:DUF3592 domain-containing protein [Streptomyces sp. J2-1]|uniref:DUF3592 domain-containing protein n=1 Tax=Streptomyces corallincola TaxID=2851888 RepID=UPI001C392520|nr:DUF3592 domain-containing protein [Streptomyces corallincola]MBV2357554.1 DUF3592 domain-containing protein [Streptomyces corallincola]
MDSFFYLVPVLMICFFALIAYRLVSRAGQLGRTWSRGLVAEGRCVGTHTATRTTTHGEGAGSVHTTLHHVYEFTTREGDVVRFSETGGRATVVAGDHVPVRYLPECPEQATTHPPARARLVAGTAVAVLFLGVAVTFCLAFMGVVHLTFLGGDGSGGFPDPGGPMP